MSVYDELERINNELNSRMLNRYSNDITDDVVFPEEIITEQIDELSASIKEPLERQMNAVESIAESAKTQSNLAVAQSETARRTSRIANLKSTLSVIFTAISMIGTLLANADGIIHNVQKILSHLNTLIH